MKIALVTDAWAPQVNGVVRALATTAFMLAARGIEVAMITPDRFRTLPCPTYPEIRLALNCGTAVARQLDALDPDAVHIATEGPLGWAARRWCRREGRAFTTSFHTRFPDYAALRTGLPAGWFWHVVRRFHAPAARTFAVTRSLADELRARGVERTHHWPLGVDLSLFSPTAAPHPAMAGRRLPVQLSVGRVAVEKNLGAFLDTGVPGSKVVVGDGPALPALRAAYPHVLFLGALHGAGLASAYAAADVFVFPSRTDTFGLVNLEALASGLPVAAFPVAGPLDIVGRDGCGQRGRSIGALDDNLDTAIRRALDADRAACVAEARLYDWERCTDQFIVGLEVRPARASRPPLRIAA